MPTFPVYVATGYVDFDYTTESVQEGRLDDFSWDQFSEDGQYIDRTWEEWYGDVWDYSAVAFTFGILSKSLGGYAIAGGSSLSVIATQADTTANRLRDQESPFTFSSAASLSGLGGFLTGGGANITAVASQDATPNRLRDQESPFTFTSAFSQSARGNATFGPSPSLAALFSQIANGSVTRGIISQTLPAIFTQTTRGNYLIAALQPLNLQAFAFEFAEGALISLPDPYFTIKALREIRAYIVPQENRIIECLMESRVNTAPTERRGIEVLQETRNYRIFTPEFKNRYSIPRVRGDY